MTIDIKTLAQNALATIISRQSNAVVSVVANSNTVDGVQDTQSKDASLEDSGEMGVVTSTVRCNSDDIGRLTLGQTIAVGGVSVSVMSSKVDPAGAIVAIEYSQQRPITA